MEDESSLTNEIREINQPRSAINKVLVQYIYIYIYSKGSSRKMCCSGSVYFGVPNMRNQKKDNWLVVSTPLKNISQLGIFFPIYGKIKNVPNHQAECNAIKSPSPSDNKCSTVSGQADITTNVWPRSFALKRPIEGN